MRNPYEDENVLYLGCIDDSILVVISYYSFFFLKDFIHLFGRERACAVCTHRHRRGEGQAASRPSWEPDAELIPGLRNGDLS